MSIYDIIEKISTVTKLYHRKKYDDYFVVAKFYIKDKEINYYFKDYTKEKLMHHLKSSMYSHILVNLDFWDYSFCKPENLFRDDVKNIINDINYTGERENFKDSRIAVGFLITLTTIYNIIYKSYISINHYKSFDGVNFDKNLLKKVLNKVDIVVDYSYSMLKLIKSLYVNDDITDFLITPSGNFRLSVRDIPFILDGTPKVHEISQIIFNTVTNAYEMLNYYRELLSVCGNFYNPRIITSYNSENILLNILKTNLNLDLYENFIMDILKLYIDKGGSIDIDFKFEKQDEYDEIIPLLDTIKEYHLF